MADNAKPADKPEANDDRKPPAGLVKARGLLAEVTEAANRPGADVQAFNRIHVRAQELVDELAAEPNR